MDNINNLEYKIKELYGKFFKEMNIDKNTGILYKSEKICNISLYWI